jgi:dolichol-phosphate hexosyltransferase
VKLSVMPVYNEAATLAEAVKAVLEAVYPCEMELVVVDDGSTDTTPQILAGLRDERIVVCRHVRNRCCAARLRWGTARAPSGVIRPSRSGRYWATTP